MTPFPSVWHKAGDNGSAIDWDDTEDLNKILRVFVAEYLQERIQFISQVYLAFDLEFISELVLTRFIQLRNYEFQFPFAHLGNEER